MGRVDLVLIFDCGFSRQFLESFYLFTVQVFCMRWILFTVSHPNHKIGMFCLQIQKSTTRFRNYSKHPMIVIWPRNSKMVLKFIKQSKLINNSSSKLLCKSSLVNLLYKMHMYVQNFRLSTKHANFWFGGCSTLLTYILRINRDKTSSFLLLKLYNWFLKDHSTYHKGPAVPKNNNTKYTKAAL